MVSRGSPACSKFPSRREMERESKRIDASRNESVTQELLEAFLFYFLQVNPALKGILNKAMPF